MMTRRLYTFVAVTLLTIVAAACQPQPALTRVPPTLTAMVVATSASEANPAPTAAPTAAATVAPTDTTSAAASGTSYPSPAQAGYPASAGEPTPGYTAPGSGPSAGMPAVDNRSKVTAKLIDSAPDADSASYTRLHVLVLTSEDVEKMQNFTRKLINTEADLYVETAKLPALKAGDQFEATVSYKGDEKGGKYFATDIQKK